jgi:hypothetical protein
MSNYLVRKLDESGNIFKNPGYSQFESDIYFKRLNSYSTHGSHSTHRRLLSLYGQKSEYIQNIQWAIRYHTKRRQNPVVHKQRYEAMFADFNKWMEEGMICCGTTEEDNAPFEFKLKPT